jgi:hypothetical protein
MVYRLYTDRVELLLCFKGLNTEHDFLHLLWFEYCKRLEKVCNKLTVA